jgi:ABC-type phosphonate transport system ATPase subunit
VARRTDTPASAGPVYAGGEFLFDLWDLDVQPLWGEADRVLWADGESLMIVGPNGSGKSTLAQQVVLSLIGVRAPTFLGYPIESLPNGQRVLYLAMDRPRQVQRSMLRMVGASDRRKLDARLAFGSGARFGDRL